MNPIGAIDDRTLLGPGRHPVPEDYHQNDNKEKRMNFRMDVNAALKELPRAKVMAYLERLQDRMHDHGVATGASQELQNDVERASSLGQSLVFLASRHAPPPITPSGDLARSSNDTLPAFAGLSSEEDALWKQKSADSYYRGMAQSLAPKATVVRVKAMGLCAAPFTPNALFHEQSAPKPAWRAFTATLILIGSGAFPRQIPLDRNGFSWSNLVVEQFEDFGVASAFATARAG